MKKNRTKIKDKENKLMILGTVKLRLDNKDIELIDSFCLLGFTINNKRTNS